MTFIREWDKSLRAPSESEHSYRTREATPGNTGKTRKPRGTEIETAETTLKNEVEAEEIPAENSLGITYQGIPELPIRKLSDSLSGNSRVSKEGTPYSTENPAQTPAKILAENTTTNTDSDMPWGEDPFDANDDEKALSGGGGVGKINPSASRASTASSNTPEIEYSNEAGTAEALVAFGMSPDIAKRIVHESGSELCGAWLEYAQAQRSPVGPGLIVSKVRAGAFPPGYVTQAQRVAQEQERGRKAEQMRVQQQAAQHAQQEAQNEEARELAELDKAWDNLSGAEKRILDDQVKRRLGPLVGQAGLNNGAVAAMRRNILRRELGYEGYEDAA